MPYESRLHVVQQHMFLKGFDEAQTSSVIAMVDLSAAGGDTTPVGRLIRESIDGWKAMLATAAVHPVGFYGSDGSTIHSEDTYGDPVTPIPLEKMVAALNESLAIDPYRRFALVLAVLEPFLDKSTWPDNRLVLLHCGH